jgi:hypothetical protein
MKYQRPKLHPIDGFTPAFNACASGDMPKLSPSCLTGVNASRSACSQGIHPDYGCKAGTLPTEFCKTGSGDSEW